MMLHEVAKRLLELPDQSIFGVYTVSGDRVRLDIRSESWGYEDEHSSDDVLKWREDDGSS